MDFKLDFKRMLIYLFFSACCEIPLRQSCKCQDSGSTP